MSANTTTSDQSNTELQAELLGIDQVPGKQAALENARIGYQVAVSLWMYEGELIWSKYNAMLVVNSLILGVIGITRNIKDTSPILLLGLPIAGIFLCIAWLQLTKRGFEQHSYWISSARELEEQYLSPTVKTISRGGRFAFGHPINITIGNTQKSYRLSFFSRAIRASWNTYLIIAVFIALYTALLMYK